MTKLPAHDPHALQDQPDTNAPSELAELAELAVPAERGEPSEAGFERGARVRVTKGPFTGKSGVVQDLVGRRSARVMLGRLPVQIDLDDLSPSAGSRGRPRLTSSHRKPVPARS
jgi:transcription antitermination factor NusG